MEGFFRGRPGHALAALFVITVLLPGLLLAIFGIMALRQERSRADQEIQQRLDRAADTVAGALERQFHDLQAAVDRIPGDRIADPARFPEKIRRALEEPDAGILITRTSSGTFAYPSGRLLFEPATEEESEPALPAAFAAAEMLEFRDKDYPKAISAYQKLLPEYPRERPRLLLRIARSYRKAGVFESAAATYRDLGRDSSTRIGGAPADLVARYELCSILSARGPADALHSAALQVYGDLVRGYWRLDEFRYSSYSDGLRAWLEASPPTEEFARLHTEEEQKLPLNRAAAQLLGSRQRFLRMANGPAVAFTRSDPFAGLVLSGIYVKDRLWPEVVAAAGSENFSFVVLDAAGNSLLATGPVAMADPSTTRSLESLGLPWRLRVQPRNPEALYADFRRRQYFYLFVVVMTLALLLSGGYLTLRTVRREIEVARLKSDFVSAVSHEFRSPLTGIRHVGELLREGRVKSEERRQEYYEMICRESDRLTRLVENLLDFSRMEDGRKEYRFASMETTEWLRALAAEFQAEIASKGVTVAASIPESLPELNADRESLSCAVHNLLDNAVKYSPDAKTVWLEAEAGIGEVIIRVRDQGVGIAEADRKHVFEKFYRGGGAAKETKGAGLGLALAVRIVRAHGGAIEVQSQPGAGSTFTIRLPEREQSRAQAGI
jgi:signal transduction histidine kinase